MSSELDADREAALATLTPEERAAIAEDISPEEKAALEEIAGDGDDVDKVDGEGGAVVAPAGAAAPKTPSTPAVAAPETPAAPAVTAEVETEPDVPFQPRFTAELPADYADQVQALVDKEAELAAKFKDGEMEADAFIAEQQAIAAKRGELSSLKTKADTFGDMNEQSAAQEWQWSINRFFKQVKASDGIDYVADAAKNADLDAFVKVLAANPAHVDKDYDWFLSEAHKRTLALHGVVKKAPSKPDDKIPPRKPSVENLPANLAEVPGGDGPGDVADEFADIDKLEGMEFERALTKMPKETRERYLQAA